jgi:hypothetical protein
MREATGAVLKRCLLGQGSSTTKRCRGARQSEALILHQRLGPILHDMRTLFVAVFLVAGLCAVDLWAFDGHYRRAAWQHAASQGTMFQQQVNYLLRRLD